MELWAVEHSNMQDCFHIDTIENILKINNNNLKNKGNSDYQIIFLGTYEDCNKYIKKIKITLQDNENML